MTRPYAGAHKSEHGPRQDHARVRRVSVRCLTTPGPLLANGAWRFTRGWSAGSSERCTTDDRAHVTTSSAMWSTLLKRGSVGSVFQVRPLRIQSHPETTAASRAARRSATKRHQAPERVSNAGYHSISLSIALDRSRSGGALLGGAESAEQTPSSQWRPTTCCRRRCRSLRDAGVLVIGARGRLWRGGYRGRPGS